MRRLKIIKSLIIIRYIYVLKKAFKLFAFCFEAGEGEARIFHFLSPDLITLTKERTYKPWLLNLYSYTRNNPMSYTDPWGLFEIELKSNSISFPLNRGYKKYEDRVQMSPLFKINFKSKSTAIIKGLLDIYSMVNEVKMIVKGEKIWKRVYNTFKLLIKGKNILDSLFEQEATVKNPFVLESSLSTKEKLSHYIKYKVEEYKTDEKLKELYNEMYENKKVLNTMEVVRYLKKIKRRYGEDIEVIYPEFNKILTYAVKQEPDWLIKRIIEIKRNKLTLTGQYRYYYLRPKGLNIYTTPTTKDLYRYLRDMWIEIQEFYFKKIERNK